MLLVWIKVREELGRIVIEPIRRKEYKVENRFVYLTNLHQPIEPGALIGKEVWEWRGVFCRIQVISFGWNSPPNRLDRSALALSRAV